MTIYFISTKGISDAPIKIGVTADVDHRLSNLQTSHHEELEILATMEGGAEVEAYLHEAMAEFRVRGEWFRRSPELVAMIERAKVFGSRSLPISEPSTAAPVETRCAKADVEKAKMLCREIAARLAPDANFVEQIAAVQRKLSRVSPSTSQSRVRAIYYGEAKRIDHFEMDALNNVRTRVLRLDDAIKMLEYAPIMAAALKEEGEPLDACQARAFSESMKRWRKQAAEDAEILGLMAVPGKRAA